MGVASGVNMEPVNWVRNSAMTVLVSLDGSIPAFSTVVVGRTVTRPGLKWNNPVKGSLSKAGDSESKVTSSALAMF